MKLYTEEQVRRAISLTLDSPTHSNLVLDHLNPIELPSSDDLFKQAIKQMEEWYGDDCKVEVDAYFRGAMWMKQQIQGGNK